MCISVPWDSATLNSQKGISKAPAVPSSSFSDWKWVEGESFDAIPLCCAGVHRAEGRSPHLLWTLRTKQKLQWKLSKYLNGIYQHKGLCQLALQRGAGGGGDWAPLGLPDKHLTKGIPSLFCAMEKRGIGIIELLFSDRRDVILLFKWMWLWSCTKFTQAYSWGCLVRDYFKLVRKEFNFLCPSPRSVLFQDLPQTPLSHPVSVCFKWCTCNNWRDCDRTG